MTNAQVAAIAAATVTSGMMSSNARYDYWFDHILSKLETGKTNEVRTFGDA